MSGQTIYAYVGGNPLSYVDLRGESLTTAGLVAVGLLAYGGYKLYTSFENQILCEKECKIQCESVVSCGDPDKIEVYQNNVPRCRNACVPQCILGKGPKKGPTGPQSPSKTPKFWEE